MNEQYYPLDLPSKLKPYSSLGVSEVSVRMMKGKDEKFVSDLTMTNFDKKYSLLLSQLIKGIDPKELTLGDRMFIALWLSMNCYTHLYPIEIMCEHCFRTIEIEADLRNLTKIELPDDFSEPKSVTISDGTAVPLRLLRVKDSIAYSDYVASKKSEDTLRRLAMTMVDERSMIDRMLFLENLSVKDLSKLREFHDQHIHGIDLSSYTYECPQCKEVGNTPIPFRLELLFPDSTTVGKTS